MKCKIRSGCNLYDSNLDTCKYEDAFCLREFKLPFILAHSNLTESQLNLPKLGVSCAPAEDVQAYQTLEDTLHLMGEFVAKGKNLLIQSEKCGNGKTTWAIQLLKAYLNGAWIKADISDTPGIFVNIPNFFIAMKDEIGTNENAMCAFKQKLLDANLVVWDELGCKALSEYEHEQLYNIINYRIDNGKANIYTTNMGARTLGERLGDRLYSRTVNSSKVIVFKGPDARRRKCE